MKFLNKIKEQYQLYYQGEEHPSKYGFLAEIFNICTDDSGEGSAQEYIVTKMLKVIECIAKKETYEYHGKSQKNYLNYLTMVNMPFLIDKIEFGTSIRGCWFSLPFRINIIEIHNILISRDEELNEFMLDLVEFMKHEDEETE
jgi:hypothetical protein